MVPWPLEIKLAWAGKIDIMKPIISCAECHLYKAVVPGQFEGRREIFVYKG